MEASAAVCSERQQILIIIISHVSVEGNKNNSQLHFMNVYFIFVNVGTDFVIIP